MRPNAIAPVRLLMTAVTACPPLGLCSALIGQANFTPVGDLPGGDFHSYAVGVSADGEVVVGSSKANFQISGHYRAFRWTKASGMEALGHIGPANADDWALAASADGSVIVGRSDHGFTWTADSGMVDIGDCTVIGVSHDGSMVVGSCAGAKGLEAAAWTQRAGWTLFGALGADVIDSFFSGVSADNSTMCGQSMLDGSIVEPIIWTEVEGMVALGDVPGGIHYALGMAISADGSTIVGAANSGAGTDAFRWTAATGLENLEFATPGVTESAAGGVTADGALIVGFADTLGAMIWDQTHGMRSLQQVLLDEFGLELTGWTLLGATGISDDGLTIVGHGWNPEGKIEGWRVRLPGPTIGDLTGDGLVNVDDVLVVIKAWGACPGPPTPCPADLDDNQAVEVDDLLIVINNWS